VFIAVFAGIGVLLFLHRGDAEGSARIANRELDDLIEPGEVVERRVPVMQRHWWNLYRVTHGVLAATDRRLVYVGVPPEDLLPREPEPIALETGSYTYDRATADTTNVAFGTLPGAIIGDGTERAAFGIARSNRAQLRAVLGVLERRQVVMRAAAEAERQTALAVMEQARQPIYHVVARGEALESIAAQYSTAADSLRSWNQLTSDRIKVGQRLLVKRRS
jgi:hypothetical protein